MNDLMLRYLVFFMLGIILGALCTKPLHPLDILTRFIQYLTGVLRGTKKCEVCDGVYPLDKFSKEETWKNICWLCCRANERYMNGDKK